MLILFRVQDFNQKSQKKHSTTRPELKSQELNQLKT